MDPKVQLDLKVQFDSKVQFDPKLYFLGFFIAMIGYVAKDELHSIEW